MAEAFRAGLQSVAKGQIDSAKVLVCNRLKFLDMRHFSQALAISIPAIGANCLISD